MRRLFCILLLFLSMAVSGLAKEGIKPSTASYTMALLPLMNTSTLDQRTLEAVANAVDDAVAKKYPPKKTKVQFITTEAVNEALLACPLENPEAPRLDELVRLGRYLRADRVLYVGVMAASDKESGFMVLVGSGTIRANVTLKQKCVDVQTGSFLFNENTTAKGASNSVNVWRIGSPSKLRAVKKGAAEAMRQMLISFD